MSQDELYQLYQLGYDPSEGIHLDDETRAALLAAHAAKFDAPERP